MRFLLVYVREAHALEEPLTVEERGAMCSAAARALQLPFPAVVDRLDDQVSQAYEAFPSRLLLLSPGGRVAFAGAPGPAGFDPDALELAILRELTGDVHDPAPASARQTGSRGLLEALDGDGDGSLSSAEIDAAGAVLRGFDLDHDGTLTPVELRRALRPARPEPLPESPPEPSARPATQEEAPSRREERSPQSYDYDGDGRLSRIEVPRPLLERWELLDTNDDGYLDAGEQASLSQRQDER